MVSPVTLKEIAQSKWELKGTNLDYAHDVKKVDIMPINVILNIVTNKNSYQETGSEAQDGTAPQHKWFQTVVFARDKLGQFMNLHHQQCRSGCPHSH